MRLTILAAAAVLLTTGAAAAYDDSWYVTEFWSGEYPNGFAVAAPDIAVPARAAMDREAPASLTCPLPYKAVFSPWNEQRNQANEAKYFTASKIVPLVATADFVFEHGEAAPPLQVKRGQPIEYLIYGAEGSFLVRIDGKEYWAYQEQLEQVEAVDDTTSVQEEWLSLRCADGTQAWILTEDLLASGEDGQVRYRDGLWSTAGTGPGFVEYGIVRDLTDEEIAAGDPAAP
jgi:hypothetical protein